MLYYSQKSDSHVIWSKHVPPPLAAKILALAPSDRIQLKINGIDMCFERMKDGVHPTNGIKIVEGRAAWERIQLSDPITIEVIADPSSTIAERGSKRTPPAAPAAGAIALPSRPSRRLHLFDEYFFSDYTGAIDTAAQRRAIRAAHAIDNDEPKQVGRSMTRDGLLIETLERLRDATKHKRRLIGGWDHQYGIPLALAKEIGLPLNWRKALRAFCDGSYGGPSMGHPCDFAKAFNTWLAKRGGQPYFYSATKATEYGLGTTSPRPTKFGQPDPTVWRLTELSDCGNGSRAKPLARVGDNGTVGGQSLVGMRKLLELLDACDREGIPVLVWPFDRGFDISKYDGHHVLIEPYPSAVRPAHIPQTDWDDAASSLIAVQSADRAGNLKSLLDLKELPNEHHARALFEGWIFAHPC